MPTLRIIEGSGAGLAVEVHEDLSIGRDASCGVQLGDVKASRKHAYIRLHENQWQIQDAGSANGTWVGKQKCKQGNLQDGSEFRIGSTVLRFELSQHGQVAGLEDDDAWGDTITGLEESQLLSRQHGEGDLAASNDYLVLLHEVVRRSHTATDREELFDILDDIAAEALDGDRCAVFLPKASSWLLWPPHERRLRARFGATPFAGTLLREVQSNVKPLLCTARGDVDPSLSMAQAGVRSAMVAPLRIGEEVHALLYVDRLDSAEPFSRSDLEFLEAVANQLAVRLHNMSEVSRLHAEVERLSQQRPVEEITLIGSDTHLGQVRSFIQQAAKAEQALLLIGEDGTGKHSVARAIHLASDRNQAPLQTLSCAGLDEAMCELSLFGRAAGEIEEARPGLLELADGGSVLIDDVDALSPAIQRRLLQFIQQGQVQRQGDSSSRKVHVRLMTAMSQSPTNSDLISELAQSLETLSVRLPPLRERHDDFEDLVDYFIQDAATRLDQPVRRLSADARGVLLSQQWPGNIRQLRLVIERAMVVAQSSIIKAEDLPESLHQEADQSSRLGPTPLIPLAEMERRHILHMLEHCGGNKKAAAELLGIDRSTLYAKLRQYGEHS